MDKLLNRFLKEVSEEMEIPESDVYDVINWQFKSAQKATYEHRTVEISNLGHFEVRPKKILKKIKTLEACLLSYRKNIETAEEPQKTNLHHRILSAEAELAYLKNKVDEKDTQEDT